MISLGFVSKKMLTNWNGVSHHLPDFQFHEKHSTLIKTNHPEKIMSLIKAFDLEQDVVIRRLMSIRKLPQKLQNEASKTCDNEFGLQTFTLLHESDSELCYGLRGEFWRADLGLEKFIALKRTNSPHSQVLLSCCFDIKLTKSMETNPNSLPKRSFTARIRPLTVRWLFIGWQSERGVV